MEKIESQKRESIDNMTHIFDDFIERLKPIDRINLIGKIKSIGKKNSKDEKYE